MNESIGQLRQKFVKFFVEQNHQKISSSSLIPHQDPTLLFTNAGMNQFKDYFTGKAVATLPRAVTIQKCVRAGGKHNDLENVGFTARHHTFFEMLGNFSFGDYFKRDAINYAWTFLTQELGVSPDRLIVTVHHSDDEAAQIWEHEVGLTKEKIFRKGDQDNFWEMGEFGPCGPCSEIYFDHGGNFSSPDFTPSPENPFDDGGRFVEIWNLVFMQYEKTPEGITTLPRPCVDTGAGLERLAAAVQGKYWNYDTDGFLPIITQLEEFTGKNYQDPLMAPAMRVVADHIRAATMLITDGVLPANEGRGHVLRRIIRRAVRKLRELSAPAGTFSRLVPTVFSILGAEYPQNQANAQLAEKMLQLEEKKFLETLDLGLRYLQQAVDEHRALGHCNSPLPGSVLFKLYDTFGFPVDLSLSILQEQGLAGDVTGHEQLMAKYKEDSRKSWKGGLLEDNQWFYRQKEQYGETNFLGYFMLETTAKLVAMEKHGAHFLLIFDQTPFYGESGGQLADIGAIFLNSTSTTPISQIIDVQKPVDGLWVHFSPDGENLEVGQTYYLKVNRHHRQLTARHHSATHLLQSALISVLGDHIKQAGSSVGPQRLRFDFTHPEALTTPQLHQIEKIINQQIRCGQQVSTVITNKATAIKRGALALFGERYGEEVRLIEMGNISHELCGGTHVNDIAEIGIFSLLNETSLSSGVRRIEACVSEAAWERLRNRSELLKQIEKLTNLKESLAVEKIELLQQENRELKKESSRLSEKIQRLESGNLFHSPEKVGNFIFVQAQAPEQSDLKKLSDLFFDQYVNGIILLVSPGKGKFSILLRSAKNAEKVDCVEILKAALAEVKGKGGGRRELAQGSAEVNDIFPIIRQIKDRLWSVLE